MAADVGDVVVFTVRIKRDRFDLIQAWAKYEKRSMSQMTKILIDEALDSRARAGLESTTPMETATS